MSWKVLCQASELEVGGMKECEVDGFKVLVLRGNEEICVIPPLCPHQEEPLLNGIFDGCVLTCCKHLWQWQVDPWDGPQGDAKAPLKRYEVEVSDDGEVCIFFNEALEYDYEN